MIFYPWPDFATRTTAELQLQKVRDNDLFAPRKIDFDKSLLSNEIDRRVRTERGDCGAIPLSRVFGVFLRQRLYRVYTQIRFMDSLSYHFIGHTGELFNRSNELHVTSAIVRLEHYQWLDYCSNLSPSNKQMFIENVLFRCIYNGAGVFSVWTF